ncbi:MAG: GNAT family N-acetyltransferase [Alphaproteobacteria bacterium]|nr:GNAT family N-acetyltransferase [Alphaproteobacteria bacterium]
MLHLIDSTNRDTPRSQRLLEASYRVRHDEYVHGRGWKALEKPDGREVDQFDTVDASYLLWADDEEVLGGARLIPTDRPHLMSDVFPHLVTLGALPRVSNVWELTRLFSTRKGESSACRRRVTGDVFAAMFEFAIAYDLEAISIVCDAFFVTRFLGMGLEVRPLGLPTAYDEGTCIAVLLPANLKQLRIARGPNRGTVLFDVDPLGRPVPPPAIDPRPPIHAH